MSEANILRQIMWALSEHDILIFRNNVGCTRFPNGSVVRYGLFPGSSDLIGIRKRDGRFLAIEVKKPGQNAKPHQQNFIDRIKEAGGIAGVARSIDEALKIAEGQ